MKVLGVILARGGSVGVKRKNLRDLGGLPLIAHTIKAAAGSSLLTTFCVSTEDKEIASKFLTHVLSKGGTEHPMTLYKRFRGEAPKPDALLKRAGLLVE